MAIYEKEVKDGIQDGHALDYCWKCIKPWTIYEAGQLEYKEIFKIHVNGMDYTLCMKHFQEMLGDYVLKHKDTISNEDTIEIPKEIITNGTEQDVLEYIKKAINHE